MSYSMPEWEIEEDVEQSKPVSKEPAKGKWYESLPQANLSPEVKGVASLGVGALGLTQPALLLDFLNILAHAQSPSQEIEAKEMALEHGMEFDPESFRKGQKKALESIPSSETITAPLKQLLGLSKKPEGIERSLHNLGEYLQMVKGRGLKSTIAKGIGLTAGEEVTASALGDEARDVFKLAAPLATQGLEAVVKGRNPETGRTTLKESIKGNKEFEDLYEYGKKIGLTEEQITPLIQSEGKLMVFGRPSRNTRQTRKVLDDARKQIGDNYDALKKKGSSEGYLSPKDQNDLFQDLAEMWYETQKTNVASPDTQEILRILEEAGNNVRNNPQTINELINTYQNLNAIPNWSGIPNWNGLKDGKSKIRQANKIFEKAIRAKSPQIADEFALTNRLYQKHAQFQDITAIERQAHKIGVPSEVYHLLHSLAFGAATGHLGASVGVLGAVEGMRRLSNQLLTNPKLQGIHRNILRSLESGNKKAILNAFKQVEPLLHDEQMKEDAQYPEWDIE